MNKRITGGQYEQVAALYLQKQGLTILEYNFSCRSGEIDLIARDGQYFVFVEVKYRYTPEQGWACEAVDRRKQNKILKVAKYYLVTRIRSLDVPCRFDVIGIDGEQIRWYKDAFQF